MSIAQNSEKKIEELQILEQQLQHTLVEKQTVQVELSEIENALGELEKTQDEVYKILDGVMIRSTKEKIIKELENKKKILDIRINAIEKQEVGIQEKLEKSRKDVAEILASRH